ncbi:hypothetical protein ACWEOE_10710 [Amycolatopsis sp. NPDC004368]
MSELDDAGLRVAALKVVSDYTKTCYDIARAEMDGHMAKGDRRIVRTDGVKLAAVSKSDPDAKAKVVDRAAFEQWAAKTYPEKMSRGYEIAGSTKEVVDVLFEHAPELLRPVQSSDAVLKLTLTNSARLGVPTGPGGEADVPGIEVEHPAGVVSCRPDDDALGHVIQLFRDGRLSLESLAPKEIAGGEA